MLMAHISPVYVQRTLGNGGVAVFAMTSQVTGHPTVFMKDRDGCCRHAYVELLSP